MSTKTSEKFLSSMRRSSGIFDYSSNGIR